MNQNYWTPIKQYGKQDVKQFNTQHYRREGDWLCANCKNINFSFRKKCNRCKTQTKKKNQTASVYSYYYYNNKQNSGEEKEKMSADSSQNNQSLNSVNYQYKTPSHHQRPVDTQTPQKNRQKLNKSKDSLPSVSPLVKKYREKQLHTTLQKISSFELDQNTQKFLESIQIRDFDQILRQDELNFNLQNLDNEHHDLKLKQVINTLPQNDLKLKKYVSCNIQNRGLSQDKSSDVEQMSEMDLYMLQMQEIIGRIII